MIGRLLVAYREWAWSRWLLAQDRAYVLRNSNRRHLAAQRVKQESAARRRLDAADRLLDAWERTRGTR